MKSDGPLTFSERAQSTTRLVVLAVVAVALFSALLLRCYFLQILEGAYYAGVSESNAIQQRVLRPARGVLLDCHGRVLATNRPSFDITFLPKGVSRADYDRVAATIAAWTKQNPDDILRLMMESRRRPFTSVILAADVTRKVISMVSEQRAELPGVIIEDRALRYYPLGASAAHLLGYIGEVSAAELEEEEKNLYIRGDWIGRAGIELALEDRLAGVKGYEDVEVDALGQTIRKLNVKPPIPGAVVTLTIDADLQQWAHEAFGDSTGALVAIEPATGKILALYSAPAYDPGVFVDRKRSSERSSLFIDQRLPLFNRALQSTYSPGSTFKTVTMIAGLITGKLTRATRFSCSGIYAGMKCWKKGGHGTLDLIRAYKNSCNVYFYQAGERILIEPIHRVAVALGLDQFPNFGLGPEAPGLVPTPEWKRAHVTGSNGEERWYTGDVRNTAIGQGFVLVSPAQMARLVASAVMGGLTMKPGVIEKIESADGTVVEFEKEIQSNLDLSPENLDIVRTGMREVVENGTAHRAMIDGLSVGGKTGTAQNPQGLDHAWFICAAPMDTPRIAMCVLVEHAGHGGVAAAPIARYVLERYAQREGWIDTAAIKPHSRRRKVELSDEPEDVVQPDDAVQDQGTVL